MTEKDIINYFPMTVTSVFRIIYCLEEPSIDGCFALIYQSEFYEIMTNNPDDMFAFAPYWAYEWIAREDGKEPLQPKEQYRTGLDIDKLTETARFFESLRLETKASPTTLSTAMAIHGFFSKLVKGEATRDEVRKSVTNHIFHVIGVNNK